MKASPCILLVAVLDEMVEEGVEEEQVIQATCCFSRISSQLVFPVKIVNGLDGAEAMRPKGLVPPEKSFILRGEPDLGKAVEKRTAAAHGFGLLPGAIKDNQLSHLTPVNLGDCLGI